MRKWAYGLNGKLKIAAVLFGVLALLLWSNLKERKRAEKLQTAFSAIYEDRLMVEGFIFDLSSILHERKQTIDNLSGNELSEYQKEHLNDLDSKIKILLSDYAATKFTDLEKKVFSEFKAIVPSISLIGSGKYEDQDVRLAENELLTKKALSKLTMLSEIQTKEGQRLIEVSNEIMLQKKSSSQFEMISLIALAIIIQVILFSSTSLIEKIKQKPHLN